MDRFVDRMLDSITVRLVVAGLAVVLPVGLCIGWLGAAYQSVMWGVNPWNTAFRLCLFGCSACIMGGYVILYPLERWLIRERAVQSWRWTGLRVLLYMLAGFPIGWVSMVSIRFGVQRYPAIVESIYFVETVANGAVVALLYTFVERVTEEMQKREARLMAEIEQLRIEIDVAQKAKQVAEITGTEYFRYLQHKARELRGATGAGES